MSQSQISVPSLRTEECSVFGSFVSDKIFKLSRKVLTNTEIKVLEKALDFAPVQKKLNALKLRKDFKDFCRRMLLKWYFRDKPTPFFSEQPFFSHESPWNTSAC